MHNTKIAEISRTLKYILFFKVKVKCTQKQINKMCSVSQKLNYQKFIFNNIDTDHETKHICNPYTVISFIFYGIIIGVFKKTLKTLYVGSYILGFLNIYN